MRIAPKRESRPVGACCFFRSPNPGRPILIESVPRPAIRIPPRWGCTGNFVSKFPNTRDLTNSVRGPEFLPHSVSFLWSRKGRIVKSGKGRPYASLGQRPGKTSTVKMERTLPNRATLTLGIDILDSSQRINAPLTVSQMPIMTDGAQQRDERWHNQQSGLRLMSFLWPEGLVGSCLRM